MKFCMEVISTTTTPYSTKHDTSYYLLELFLLLFLNVTNKIQHISKSLKPIYFHSSCWLSFRDGVASGCLPRTWRILGPRNSMFSNHQNCWCLTFVWTLQTSSFIFNFEAWVFNSMQLIMKKSCEPSFFNSPRLFSLKVLQTSRANATPLLLSTFFPAKAL